MLINDTTFLLDESVDTLKNIRDTQDLMANTSEWEKLSREVRTTKQRQLATDERQCKSYLTLASETVDMLHYLTQDIKEPFLQEVGFTHHKYSKATPFLTPNHCIVQRWRCCKTNESVSAVTRFFPLYYAIVQRWA